MREVDQLWEAYNDPVATSFLGLASHRRILDVGCGDGMWTWTLRRLARRKDLMLVGLDQDRKALELAKRRLAAGTDLVAADASSLPFREGSLDLVTCRRLLINLKPRKRRKVVQEMTRVARAKGTVSSVEPSLQTNRASQFSTVRGSLRFSRRLERAFAGTDFALGPRTAHLLVQQGLEGVKVWAYLLLYSALPPKYDSQFLNPVVHGGGGFGHALATVPPRLRRRMGGALQSEARRLDSEMRKQLDRGSFVSVSVTPVFVAKGTKPSPKHP